MTRHQRNTQRLAHLADRTCHHLIARPLVAVVFLDRTASTAGRAVSRVLRWALDPDVVVARWANETADD